MRKRVGLFLRLWAIFFLAVFGTNLAVLFSAGSEIAWAEEQSKTDEEAVDREPKPEEDQGEEKREEAPAQEDKEEEKPEEAPAQEDKDEEKREEDQEVGGDDSSPNDVKLEAEINKTEEEPQTDDVRVSSKSATEEKFEEIQVKIDGEEITVVQTTMTATDSFGRTVTSSKAEYLDPKTGELVVLETQDDFSNATLQDSKIVETFAPEDRDAVAKSLLGGESEEFRESLLAALTDEEKEVLFSAERFGEKAFSAANLDFAELGKALELRPTADFSIGASGDDNLVVPFKPLQSEKSVQAVTEIAISASVAAGAATTAAAGAASLGSGGAAMGAGSPGPTNPAAPSAPAPANPSSSPSRPGGSSPQGSSPGTPKSGGTGAGGGGGSLDGEAASFDDANEDVYDALAVAEYDVDSSAERAIGRFERWFSERRWMRLFESFDALFRGIQNSLRKVPLLHNILDDSSHLRSISGPLYLALPIGGILTGVFGALTNAQSILHPPIEIYLLLMVIGVLDTASGLLGAVVFLGLSTQTFDFLSVADYRTAFGFLMSCIGPALIARSVVGFRRARSATALSRIRDFTDLALSMVIGGWIASIMVRALPSLSGLSLPAANHVDTTHLIVSAAFGLRLALEVFAARLLPRRNARIQTPRVVSGSLVGSLLWAVGRIGIIFLLSSAFLGTGWESWVVTILVGAPHLVSIFNQRLPRFEALWKIFPYGALSLATILALEVGLEALVARFAEGLDFSTIFMLCLAPVTAGFALAQMVAQPKHESVVHWWERFPSVSVKAIAAVALTATIFFVTRLL